MNNKTTEIYTLRDGKSNDRRALVSIIDGVGVTYTELDEITGRVEYKVWDLQRDYGGDMANAEAYFSFHVNKLYRAGFIHEKTTADDYRFKHITRY